MKSVTDSAGGNRPFASVTLRGTTIAAVIGDHGPMIVGWREADGVGLGTCYLARGTEVMAVRDLDVAAGGWMIGDPTDAYLAESHVRLPGWDRGDAEAATRVLGIPGIAVDVTRVLVGSPAWSSLADAIAADPAEVYGWSHGDEYLRGWWEGAFREARRRHPHVAPASYFRHAYRWRQDHLSHRERSRSCRHADPIVRMSAVRRSYERGQRLSFALARASHVH